MSKQNIEYKVILIGNTAVGKTSLFKKLTTKEYSEKNISTIGVDKRSMFVEIEVNENNKIEQKGVDISLVDTAGEERFRAITKTYYKGTDGILLLYDITNKDSFKNVENWIETIQESLGNNKNSKYVTILIGNKFDLIGFEDFQREVEEEEAKNICEKNDLIWGGETSVKNIEMSELEKLFKKYIKYIYDKVGDKNVDKQISKKMSGYKKKKKRGCFS